MSARPIPSVMAFAIMAYTLSTGMIPYLQREATRANYGTLSVRHTYNFLKGNT